MRELEKKVKGKSWEKDKRGFEQHMLEEDNVRLDWKTGKFEQEWHAKLAEIRMHGTKLISAAKGSAKAYSMRYKLSHSLHGMILVPHRSIRRR